MSSTELATVQSNSALVPKNIEEALNLARAMAKGTLVPPHLRGNEGDCLLVVMQAQRWNMDVLSVAQCSSVVSGKLCYEGKLVAAALQSMGVLKGRLDFEISGRGDDKLIVLSGVLRGETKRREVRGTVGNWKTNNGNWKKDEDSMLVYRGTRQWARIHCPEVLLGVYTPDELDTEEEAPQNEAVKVYAVHEKEPEQNSVRDASEEKIEDADFTEVTDAEATIDLPESPLRLLRAKAKSKGLEDDASIIAKFGNVNMANLNNVLGML